ncbi:DUF368 domain-containing protein [bacterium SCSIO 12741]|nr:DUF368 domain-containing protein [bacterium SCSIO 12741]
MSNRSIKDYMVLTLKGMAMGAADVVPGVSGGTIAFISGIYEELLSTISGVRPRLITVLRKEGLKSFWKELNGNFIVALFLGILISIASLATVIKYLLREQPVLLWSFFFGLIIASVFLVGKQVRNFKAPINIIGLIAGTVIAYFITLATPTGESQNLIYIFFCGSIAITAMILPGISGSFILLLLGAYTTVLGTVSDLIQFLKNGQFGEMVSGVTLIAVFAAGCLTGLLGFSGALSWLFKKAHDFTVAVLTGFLIGSLNKVWPWKHTLESIVLHPGEPNERVVPMVEENVLPQAFNGDPQLLFAILLALAGFGLIMILDRFAPENQEAA